MNVITNPGSHRERCNGKAQVNYVESSSGWAFGYDSMGRATAWHCETGRANFGYSIIAEWHDPPSPPDGYVVMPREYGIRPGDMFSDNVTRRQGSPWRVVTSLVGKCQASLEQHNADLAPIYIASRVPPSPPEFRISDKGCGVYETRDGRQATVDSQYESTWGGVCEDERREWNNDGSQIPDHILRGDLVRYISPLPTEQPWTPTCELRLARPQNRHIGKPKLLGKCHNGHVGFDVIPEQKWTRGVESEWRPIEVTDGN